MTMKVIAKINMATTPPTMDAVVYNRAVSVVVLLDVVSVVLLSDVVSVVVLLDMVSILFGSIVEVV